MQLIRADEILGFLADLAVRGRQQLGRYRCIQNIAQHGFQHTARAARLVIDQIAHQRFGDGGVHTVHTHMVTVIGRPAERQFGQIARADHHAALLVRQIHQHQRAHTRLRVFKGYAVIVPVVSNVGKVLIDRRLDVYGLQGHAVGFRQLFRVAAGAGGRAEARHGNGKDAPAVQTEAVKRMRHHNERQRRIQPAGQADHHGFRVGVRNTARQTGRLNGQDLLAAFAALFAVFGHKGQPREVPVGKVTVRRRQGKGKYTGFRRAEGIHAPVLIGKALQINIRVNNALCKAAAFR